MTFLWRLTAGLVLIGLLVLALIVTNVAIISEASGSFAEVVDTEFPEVIALTGIEPVSRNVHAAAEELLALASAGTGPADLEDEIAEIKMEFASLTESAAAYRSFSLGDTHDRGQQVLDAVAEYEAAATAFADAVRGGDLEAVAASKMELDGSEVALSELVRGVIATETDNVAQRLADSDRSNRRLLTIVVVFAGLITMATLVLGFLLRRDYGRATLAEAHARDEAASLMRDLEDERVNKARLEVLGEVTAMVSHELRNPLGTVRTSLFSVRERLARAGDTSFVDQPLDRIERSVARCEAIVGDMLGYTRAPKLRLDSANLDDWLSDVLDDIPVPETVHVSREFDANIVVQLDAERMRRVMLNLMENSLQAIAGDGKGTDEATGHIAVATSIVGENAVIVVSDDGPGIAIDMLDKVRRPLISTKTNGVGLGLPVVVQIVEQHGGEVQVETGVSGGAIVTMNWPLDALVGQT